MLTADELRLQLNSSRLLHSQTHGPVPANQRYDPPMRPLGSAIALVVVLAACGNTDSLEDRAAERLVDCMIGNGGLEASDVDFSIDGRVVVRVELSYLGQGSSPYDAVYLSCLDRVAEELDLMVE